MKKLLSLLLVFSLLLSLAACGEPKQEAEQMPDFKAELTDSTVEYTLDELELLSAEPRLTVADKGVPALYKYFEDKVKIGVAFTSNQINPFLNVGANLVNDAPDTSMKITQGILKHYNIYVLGNEMKSDHCNPAPDTYNLPTPITL